MTLASLAERLDRVRWRGDSQFTARCPAHADRRPSFSARQTHDRILVRCWSGCSVQAICTALDLELADLFLDRRERRPRRRRTRPNQPPPLGWREISALLTDHAEKLFLRADAVLSAARGLDISAWSDAELDAALTAVARAHGDLARADLLEEAVCRLRLRNIEMPLGYDRALGKPLYARFRLEKGGAITMEVFT